MVASAAVFSAAAVTGCGQIIKGLGSLSTSNVLTGLQTAAAVGGAAASDGTYDAGDAFMTGFSGGLSAGTGVSINPYGMGGQSAGPANTDAGSGSDGGVDLYDVKYHDARLGVQTKRGVTKAEADALINTGKWTMGDKYPGNAAASEAYRNDNNRIVGGPYRVGGAESGPAVGGVLTPVTLPRAAGTGSPSWTGPAVASRPPARSGSVSGGGSGESTSQGTVGGASQASGAYDGGIVASKFDDMSPVGSSAKPGHAPPPGGSGGAGAPEDAGRIDPSNPYGVGGARDRSGSESAGAPDPGNPFGVAGAPPPRSGSTRAPGGKGGVDAFGVPTSDAPTGGRTVPDAVGAGDGFRVVTEGAGAAAGSSPTGGLRQNAADAVDWVTRQPGYEIVQGFHDRSMENLGDKLKEDSSISVPDLANANKQAGLDMLKDSVKEGAEQGFRNNRARAQGAADFNSATLEQQQAVQTEETYYKVFTDWLSFKRDKMQTWMKESMDRWRLESAVKELSSPALPPAR